MLNENNDFYIVPFSPCKNIINTKQKININIKKKIIYGKRIIKKELNIKNN